VSDARRLSRLHGLVPHRAPQAQAAAVTARGRTADPGAATLLIELTRTGTDQTRLAVINALGELGGPAAIKALGEILAGGDRQLVPTAAQVLANLGGADARLALIDAALGEHGDTSVVLSALVQLHGEDVDQALV